MALYRSTGFAFCATREQVAFLAGCKRGYVFVVVTLFIEATSLELFTFGADEGVGLSTVEKFFLWQYAFANATATVGLFYRVKVTLNFHVVAFKKVADNTVLAVSYAGVSRQPARLLVRLEQWLH